MSLRSMIGALSPAGRRARLSVTIFHRVLPHPDPLFPAEVDAARFDAQLALLKRWFDVLPLPEAVDALRAGKLPGRALAITFDDGYADNCAVALPILQRHSMRATFFISTGYLDGGRMWNDTVVEALRSCPLPDIDLRDIGLGTHSLRTIDDRRVAIEAVIGQVKYLPLESRQAKVDALAALCGVSPPNDLMLTTSQVQAMRAAGMTIGAHTVHHPILSRLSDDEARAEIGDGKAALERILGEPVRLFAYPNGKPRRDYLASHVRMAREAGFAAAFSTASGTAGAGDDVFEIPRFTPWARSPLRYGLQMTRNLIRRDIHAVDRAR